MAAEMSVSRRLWRMHIVHCSTMHTFARAEKRREEEQPPTRNHSNSARDVTP